LYACVQPRLTAARYSIYLLYWYKSAYTDAGARSTQGVCPIRMLTYADVCCTQGVCPMRLEADGAGVEKARVLLTYNSKPEAFR
jgi:hypothetical protein